jgi:hypothetical protein
VKTKEKPGIPEHHFRNLLLTAGPVSGAAGGGLRPLLETIKARAKQKPPVVSFKNLPWRMAGKGALKGIIPGAFSGLAGGLLLDAYIQHKLKEGNDMRKTASEIADMVLAKLAAEKQPGRLLGASPQTKSIADTVSKRVLGKKFYGRAQEQLSKPPTTVKPFIPRR